MPSKIAYREGESFQVDSFLSDNRHTVITYRLRTCTFRLKTHYIVILVAKFKRRARYLEFFVQVAQKALQENLPESALEWCDDSVLWLLK